jgi:bifunctional non-homologous end joining protein LigD
VPRQSRPRGAAPALHATELPKPFHRDGWIYEEKYDGWRMVAEKAGGQVTLTSRNGLDHTKRFPKLAQAIEGLNAPSRILDGKIAIFDRQLISRFEWLRARPKQHEVATPPIYMVFDLLELGGEDIRTRPLHERREALEQLAADRQLVMPTRRLPANGLAAWDEVLRGNYEGMVAKDPESAYTPGRTLSWLKVRQRGYRQEARGFDQR